MHLILMIVIVAFMIKGWKTTGYEGPNVEENHALNAQVNVDS